MKTNVTTLGLLPNFTVCGLVNVNAKTLFDKLWESHVVDRRGDGSDLLYVDRHFVHDACSQGFDFLRNSQRKVRRPDLTFGMEDHYIPTRSSVPRPPEVVNLGSILQQNAKANGFTSFGSTSHYQGIVHVVGPELGLTLPGALVVCGDSHTATHGALGCLAFGVGASEIAHVLSTQTIWQKKPKSMRIVCHGALGAGVTAKDLVLHLIGQIGARGGNGHVIEYSGAVFSELSVEGRMTVCNMSIEAGAKAGIVAPDVRTLAYLEGRPYAPKGAEWVAASAQWLGLKTDTAAVFDVDRNVAVDQIEPMVTWGTSPETSVAVSGQVPDLQGLSPDQRQQAIEMLNYMGLEPGQRLADVCVDQVFIGSCTNSRIEDLRLAADLLSRQAGKAKVPALVVPGSRSVQAQAEAEGLDRIFRDAGFEWGNPGCSMCVGMNGDHVAPGKRAVSTSNRNFRGRQGPGSRTHLASPLTAAASALTGRLTDVREML